MRITTLTVTIALLIACKSSETNEPVGEIGAFEGFAITASGTGYTAYDGMEYEFALVTECDGCAPTQQFARTHGGDLLELEFTGVQAGTWEIHYYFDANADGGCDATDPAWLVALGYSDVGYEPITIDAADNTALASDVCASFSSGAN